MVLASALIMTICLIGVVNRYGEIIGFAGVVILIWTGLGDTRIGCEIVFVLDKTVGLGGLNSSGRPDDNPISWWCFPWVCLSLTCMFGCSLVVVCMWHARRHRGE